MEKDESSDSTYDSDDDIDSSFHSMKDVSLTHMLLHRSGHMQSKDSMVAPAPRYERKIGRRHRDNAKFSLLGGYPESFGDEGEGEDTSFASMFSSLQESCSQNIASITSILSQFPHSPSPSTLDICSTPFIYCEENSLAENGNSLLAGDETSLLPLAGNENLQLVGNENSPITRNENSPLGVNENTNILSHPSLVPVPLSPSILHDFSTSFGKENVPQVGDKSSPVSRNENSPVGEKKRKKKENNEIKIDDSDSEAFAIANSHALHVNTEGGLALGKNAVISLKSTGRSVSKKKGTAIASSSPRLSPSVITARMMKLPVTSPKARSPTSGTRDKAKLRKRKNKGKTTISKKPTNLQIETKNIDTTASGCDTTDIILSKSLSPTSPQQLISNRKTTKRKQEAISMRRSRRKNAALATKMKLTIPTSPNLATASRSCSRRARCRCSGCRARRNSLVT